MAFSSSLYAVVSHRTQPEGAPRIRRSVSVIKAEKLEELAYKKAVDRVNDLLDRIAQEQAEVEQELARLQRRKRQLIERSERLSDAVIERMEGLALRRADGFCSALALVPCPSSVEIVDAGLIPAEYLRQPKTPAACPDKVAIKKVLEGGDRVPGARLLQGVSLRRC